MITPLLGGGSVNRTAGRRQLQAQLTEAKATVGLRRPPHCQGPCGLAGKGGVAPAAQGRQLVPTCYALRHRSGTVGCGGWRRCWGRPRMMPLTLRRRRHRRRPDPWALPSAALIPERGRARGTGVRTGVRVGTAVATASSGVGVGVGKAGGTRWSERRAAPPQRAPPAPVVPAASTGVSQGRRRQGSLRSGRRRLQW